MSATELYGHLIQVARDGGVIFYADAGRFLGLTMENPDHRNRLAAVLDDINRREVKDGRPMLSAVVVHSDNYRPGGGFYDVATELGVYHGEDRETFYSMELKRVHDYWQTASS